MEESKMKQLRAICRGHGVEAEDVVELFESIECSAEKMTCLVVLGRIYQRTPQEVESLLNAEFRGGA